MSLSTNCTELPAHVVQTCNDYRKGGISAFAVVDPSATIADFTSASDWTTAINAGLATVVTNIKGTLPKPSAEEGENPVACGPEKVLDGFNGTFTWKDFNVNAENDEFYSVLNQSRKILVIYNCNDNEIQVIAPAQMVYFAVPWANDPEGQKDKQLYEGTAMWYIPLGMYPSRLAAPVGIFSDVE